VDGEWVDGGLSQTRRIFGGRRVNRRQLLVGMGRGSLVVAVLGMAACSEKDSGASGARSTSGTGSASATGQADGALAWERVNLGFVSAYVLIRGSRAAVVDTGVEGSEDAIGEVLDAAGPGWARVSDVILTHRHADHAGSLPEVMKRASAATGHIGEADLAQISSPRPLKVAADGSEIFGVQVVATPGHTLGHISVFDPETGVLVTGDAVRNTSGLQGSDPQYTDDQDAAAASLTKLAKLPVKTILFGHGEPLTSGAAAALGALAS
jgi:glyoxylase-like metal-dependent hydrolase (beta-lactamase superfamily II)